MSVKPSDPLVISSSDDGTAQQPAVGPSDPNGGMTGTVANAALAGAANGPVVTAADPNGGMAGVVTVDANSEKAINADIAQATFGVDGTGLKIGLLSDSFNVLGGYAADVAGGILPNNVTVLAEGPAGSTDEGRSMLELVHKDAPGAQLYFATALSSQTTFANDIAALQAAGCNIILDDFIYFAEPFYQMGDPVENAIDKFVAAGGTYVTMAFNDGNGFYESAFHPITYNLPGGVGNKTVQDFGGGNPFEQVTTAPGGGSTDIFLQWSQPFASIGGGAGSNDSLSFYVYDQSFNFLGSATADKTGGDPFQGLSLGSGFTYNIAVAVDHGSAPSQFKMVAFGDGNGTAFDGPGNGVGSGAITGHNLDPNAITVAAVDYTQTPNFGTNPPVVENFSGVGPGELLFDKNGNPLATPKFLDKPNVAGPDGSVTDPLDPFFGTSAATPNVGAVAALVMQENPALTSQDIENLLEDSAVAMPDPTQSGAGLVQADKAVQFASNNTITAFAGGNTTLLGTHLNDTFVGNGLIVTAVFTGPRADYSIVHNADGSFTVTDNRPGSPDGTDTLVDTVFAQFSDQTDKLAGPVLGNVAATDSVTGIGVTVTLSPSVTITDAASATLASGTVSLTGGRFAGDGDVLSATTTGTAINASYDAATETLTLTGVDTLAHYAQVLDSVTFHSTSGNPTNSGADPTRTVTWTVNDGGSSNNLSPPATTTISLPRFEPFDFNGDMISDLVFQNEVTSTPSTPSAPLTPGLSGVTPGPMSGTPQIWLWNGTAVTSQMTFANPGASWHIITSRDVNGDGKADLIWQNSDGTPGIWLMNGTTPIAEAGLANPGSSWHLVAAGDLNNDGKADLIWQNTDGTLGVWLMNGTTPIAEAGIGNPGSNWKVVGAADFNSDGRDDILLQNTTTGNLMIDLMNGTSVASSVSITVGDPSWHAVSTGTFNGQAEIAWQNSNGAVGIWLMNGTTPGAEAALGNPGAAWQLVSVDHFTANGQADLLFQNTSGAMGLWEMNGTNIVAEINLPNPGAGWQSVNGHPFATG